MVTILIYFFLTKSIVEEEPEQKITTYFRVLRGLFIFCSPKCLTSAKGLSSTGQPKYLGVKKKIMQVLFHFVIAVMLANYNFF